MIEVELHVTSSQRVGLLISLSQVLIANGFSLARQRLAETADGVLLTLVARGPEPNIPSLQRSIEGQANVQAVQVVSVGPVGGSATKAASPTTARSPEGSPATARIEALLPQLARAYPKIFPALLPFERELPAEQREPTLFQMGERVGAWVYKRDYAMGGQLPLGDSLRRIAQPALRQLVNAEVQDATIRVSNSPFCNRGEPGACCHFLRGMLGGLVGGTKGAGSVRVIESTCRNTGADACVFAFQDS
jgi:predicted hydrocarbon binding protein